jgi:YggT family protein
MQAVVFLLDAIAGFFCALLLLRFMMQALRISFAGQFGDFIVRMTNWAVKPLRRVIPGFGGMDWASVVAAFAIQLLLSVVIVGLAGPGGATDPGTMALAVAGYAVRAVMRLAIYILIAAMILQAVLSWVAPHSPLMRPADQLTRPLLAPVRRIMPTVSGVDLSPLVAILLLQVVLMFL